MEPPWDTAALNWSHCPGASAATVGVILTVPVWIGIGGGPDGALGVLTVVPAK